MAERIKNPDVRFKGYTDDWKQIELGKVLTERKVLQKISDDAPILAFAAGQGVIDRSERKSNNRDHLTLDQENKIYKLTEFNDIVYNPSNLKYGAIDRNKFKRGVISPIYVTFTTEEEPSFIELIVKSEKFKLKALQYEEGTVVKRQSVSPENLLSLHVNISENTQEQNKIGSLFEDLDKYISLNQKKYDKLKSIKNATLFKMFPQQDSSIPEMRMKGYFDKWGEDSLFNLCSLFIDGDWIEAKDQSLDGIRLLQTGNVGVNEFKDRAEKSKWISEETFKELNCTEVLAGDILISRLPEPAGRACIIPELNNKAITAVDCTIIRTSDKLDSKFLVQYLSTSSYFKEVKNLLAGGTRQRISRSNLGNIKIPLPSKSEQKKIGKTLESIDKLISLQRNKLEKLMNIKKACFEKMFV